MCGLFGLISRPGHLPSQDLVTAGLNSVSHRGPDGCRLFRSDEEGLVLGHARLSIIDLSIQSDQPFETDFCILAYNGEIYNYRQLREELIKEGAEFRSAGDTEVIAVGYQRWGLKVFERLRGMYALALFDNVTGEVHLTRDPFGIKPLYVCGDTDRGYVFCSEIKPFRLFRDLSVNPRTLVDLGTWGFHFSNQSIFAEVQHVPLGSILTLCSRTYPLTSTLREAPSVAGIYRKIGAGSQPNAGSNELLTTLSNSVEDHLIADVPVALALSGGVDSSVISALAAKASKNVTAFTMTSSDGSDAEVENARLLCQKNGIKHVVAQIVIRDLGALLRDIAYHLDEPIPNINAVFSYGLAAALRQAGFKVVLVGEGSDELFGGYPWHTYAKRGGPREEPVSVFQAYRQRRASLNFRTHFQPQHAPLFEERLREQQEIFVSAANLVDASLLHKLLYFEQIWQMQFSQLMRIDRMMMAHGIEARVPYIYQAVAEFAEGLPDASLIKERWHQVFDQDEKIILRRAGAKILPSVIRKRPKFGTGGTVNMWQTAVVTQMADVYEEVLTAQEFAGARELLAQWINWDSFAGKKAAPKQQLFVILLAYCISFHILGQKVDPGGAADAISLRFR
jgi:asparagine synthase (glutamine-hydrolysing)